MLFFNLVLFQTEVNIKSARFSIYFIRRFGVGVDLIITVKVQLVARKEKLANSSNPDLIHFHSLSRKYSVFNKFILIWNKKKKKNANKKKTKKNKMPLV